MKQRILLVGSEHPLGARVRQVLMASDWATPIAFPGSIDAIDAVFNGSVGSPQSVRRNAQMLYSEIERRNRDVRVVHLSSMTVYGTREGDTTENTPLRPDLGAYCAAQIDAEALAGRHRRSVILRPGCEYGPGCPQWSTRIGRLLVAHRLGDLGANGDGVCNLIYVDDLVRAIVRALRMPDVDGQAFNLAMRAPPTWNEYLARFARVLRAVPLSRIGVRRMRLETRLLAPPLRLLEFAQRWLPPGSGRTPPAITPSLMRLCGQAITLNSEKAERLLGLEWTPLGDGLRHAAATVPPR